MSYYLAQFLRYEYATSVRFFASNSRVVSCFPSFFDNMDYIIINQSHTSQSQFFQVLATLSNNTDIFRT